MENSKRCKNYLKYIEDNPDKISDKCLNREGIYLLSEVEEHFWKSTSGRAGTCKHCEGHLRKLADGLYDPVITKDHPRDENGRLLSYWHLIDRGIILKLESNE